MTLERLARRQGSTRISAKSGQDKCSLKDQNWSFQKAFVYIPLTQRLGGPGGGLVEIIFRRDFRRLETIADLPFTRIWRKFHTGQCEHEWQPISKTQ